MDNEQISKILFEIAELYRMEGKESKALAYEKASRLIDGMSMEIEDFYRDGGIERLKDIPDIGENIAHHIADLIEGGTFEEYKNLKKKIPVDVCELLEIEGVGPRNIKILWDKLGIKNITELENAAKKGKIRELENFGENVEEKILNGIHFFRESKGRKVIGSVLDKIENLKNEIEKITQVEKVIIVGSVRRRKETVRNVDIVVISNNPSDVIESFIELAEIEQVLVSGESRVSVILKMGLSCNLRIFEKNEEGSALIYTTGSKAHNLRLQQIAKEKDMILTEYGLFLNEKKIAGETEEDIYEKLGLEYIPAEIREDKGEITVAQKRNLPKLIEYDDLKGDLQIQTDWTDGQHTIMQMAEYAIEKGLEYIAITDHTKDLSVTGGNDEKKIVEQIKEIDKLNEIFIRNKINFRILKGAEVNILKDGSLDIKDETLEKLDVVGAAIHKNFELSKEDQTERVIKAMNNPNVDIIFHLTTRVIGKRKPIELDVEKIIDVAKETGTIIEIDAFFDRLDISEKYIKICLQKGVKMSIDSDAHAMKHIDFLKHGIAQARRAWTEKEFIINSYSVEQMLGLLKNRNR